MCFSSNVASVPPARLICVNPDYNTPTRPIAGGSVQTRPAPISHWKTLMIDVSGRHYLTPLFGPASVAIIGASEVPGKVGTLLLSNMLHAGYRGALYAVNPKYPAGSGVSG